jgi:hypothetical protein
MNPATELLQLLAESNERANAATLCRFTNPGESNSKLIEAARTDIPHITEAMAELVKAMERVRKGLCYPDEYREVSTAALSRALAIVKGEK